jgi:HSF-type DNA-binding
MSEYSRISFSSGTPTRTTMTQDESQLRHNACISNNDGRGEGKSGDGNGNGKTGRRFVTHDYHDFAIDRVGSIGTSNVNLAGVASSPTSGEQTFPCRLHYCLNEMERDGLSHIVSWQPHGRCFVVHDKDRFMKEVLGRYEETRVVHGVRLRVDNFLAVE